MIVGWRAATSMRTDLVLDTLEMALWRRRSDGVTDGATPDHARRLAGRERSESD
jgi:transposase InsO family protein